MKVCAVMVLCNVLILLAVSFFVPPLPVWLGGVIGVAIFLGVGTTIATFIE
mgnify:CR=1 FL=1